MRVKRERETNIDRATIKKLLPSTSNEMRQRFSTVNYANYQSGRRRWRGGGGLSETLREIRDVRPEVIAEVVGGGSCLVALVDGVVGQTGSS